VNIHTSSGDITGAGGQNGPDAAETRTMRLGSGRGSFTVSTDSGSITISQGATI
jgi:hypothetical protein